MRKQPADIDNLLARQFVSGCGLPSKINKPCLPLVFGVVREADPFEIVRAVIGFHSVNVVDRQPLGMAFAKGKRNQSVNSFLGPFPVLKP